MAASTPAKRPRNDESSEWQPCLSSGEVDAYHREGWLIPKASLSAEEVERFRQSLDRVIAQNPSVRPELLVSAHLEAKGTEGVAGSHDFLQLGLQPLILEAVAQVLGPDFALWGCQIFCKPGFDGMEVPMHQDGEYWPIRPLSTVTVWVALDRSDKENGALRVVPRSHRKMLQHEKCEGRMVLSQRLTDVELGQLPAAVDVELDPGQFSMHDVYLVHGSNANTSPRRRAGVALRYMPTSSVLDREMFDADRAGFTIDWKNRPLFLVSGQDRSGGRNCYSPLPGPLAFPDGFRRWCCAKSPTDWAKLKTWMEEMISIPWERALEGRRVAQWGVRYDYTNQCVDLTPVATIPDFLRDFFPEVGPEFTQCIINEYGPGDGIPWHVDDLVFGPEVRVFVFGDSRPLLLRREATATVEMRHLWSYCFSGAARYDWQHSVPEGSQRRWSFTFRSLKQPSIAPAKSKSVTC